MRQLAMYKKNCTAEATGLLLCYVLHRSEELKRTEEN